MLELYLFSSIVCTVLLLLMAKFTDGQVTVGDSIVAAFLGFMPVVNIASLVCAVITILGDGNLMNKKLF